MKIQTSSRELSRTLKILSRAIPARNTMPILDNVIIRQQPDGTFRLIGGSTESTLSMTADISVIDGKEIPLIAVNPKNIIPVVDAMPDTKLTITITPAAGKDGGMLQFSYLTGEFQIPYTDGTEYPVMSASDNVACSIHLPGDIILPTIEQARTFTANDELRPVLNPVLLDVTPDECIIVATDGHRLYRRIYGNGSHGNGSPFFDSGDKTKFLLPSSLLSVFCVAFAKSEDIHFSTDGRIVHIWSDNIDYTIRPLEGNYPNYNSVIPPLSEAQTVDVSTRAMLSAVRRVSPFAPDATQMLRFSIADGQVQISAQNIDFSASAGERIDVIRNDAQDIAIGMKSSSLQQCLQAVGAEDVRMYLTSPSRPIVVTSTDANPDTLTLLMPMVLDF